MLKTVIVTYFEARRRKPGFRLAAFLNLAAARYVELNPVSARLAVTPQDYRWSSSRAHLARLDDKLVTVARLIRIAGDWKSFLSHSADGDAIDSIRRHEHTGRPLGDQSFATRMESQVPRILRRQKPGSKAKRR